MTETLPPTIEGPAQRPRRPLRYLLLAGVGVLALIGVLFVVLLLWAMRGVRLADEAGAAGRDFGAGSTDVACLAAAVGRHSGGYSGHFSLDEAEFLRECLKVASPTEDFCENIPVPSDEDASRAWYEARCAEVGIPVETCANIFSTQQYHCLERNSQSGRSKAPG